MTEDFSDENIRKNCFFCDPGTSAYKFLIEERKSFRILCDANPLREGHIIIVAKEHLSCMGSFPGEIFEEFTEIFGEVRGFVEKNYGQVASFEHGIFGQTAYHSHVHSLPFPGGVTEIIPEGQNKLIPIQKESELKQCLEKDGGYLFLRIGLESWVVDPALQAPRFFRDRFAVALGRPERADWKKMHFNSEIMTIAEQENRKTIGLWKSQH
ncbi:MAG TPA: HIT domain-containing protein [Candidatus Paceibacterota bacterium]